MIFAIDPGDVQSAYVIYDEGNVIPIAWAKEDNDLVRAALETALIFGNSRVLRVAIEMIASYGMPVGKTIFDTCVEIGRLTQICARYEYEVEYITRVKARTHMCHSAKASDSNVMHAIYDRYGGSRQTAVGTKKEPGPLYGFKKDIWQALAVAICVAESER